MCRTECLLAVFILSINLVYSWDIAITTGDQLEFYTNQTKTNNEGIRFRDLTALAYDAVNNMLLFVDKQNDNASIFSYNLVTKKYLSLVGRRSYEYIQGLTFDPISGKMFWTDTNERSIYWVSLWPRSKDSIYGNLLIKLNDEIPRDIAVDSCRGYIYWTNTNITKPTIERARLDGSERSVVVNTDIHMPVSLAVDQRTRRLYWADDKEGIHYSIESSDLEGKARHTIYAGTYHQPNALTVSKDYIYWVDWGYKSVWKLSKNASNNVEPEELIRFSNEVPFGIVANYQIDDQTAGIPECKTLVNLQRNHSIVNDSINIPKDVGLFCLHGVKTGILNCKCSPGYIGDRCEISVCQNFCLNGDCSPNSGKPVCKCHDGFTGQRCEISLCYGHCLNYGECSISKDKPVCKCSNIFEGERCETRKVEPVTEIPVIESCNCTSENSSAEAVFVYGCGGSWDAVRDPVLLALGTLAGLLALACAVLAANVLYLRRRPRIKKRIIVNKSSTPLTARPHCEITIEDCCNMNICETPCFEPRNSIRPTLVDSKPGKEEKRNLIANMEQDDIY